MTPLSCPCRTPTASQRTERRRPPSPVTCFPSSGRYRPPRQKSFQAIAAAFGACDIRSLRDSIRPHAGPCGFWTTRRTPGGCAVIANDQERTGSGHLFNLIEQIAGRRA
jgi:hypothetical protein